MPSELNRVSQTDDGIFIETKLINYFIRSDLEMYSFKGNITQVNHQFVTISDKFKTFYFARQMPIDGLNVYGSTDQHRFWLKEK